MGKKRLCTSATRTPWQTERWKMNTTLPTAIYNSPFWVHFDVLLAKLTVAFFPLSLPRSSLSLSCRDIVWYYFLSHLFLRLIYENDWLSAWMHIWTWREKKKPWQHMKLSNRTAHTLWNVRGWHNNCDTVECVKELLLYSHCVEDVEILSLNLLHAVLNPLVKKIPLQADWILICS